MAVLLRVRAGPELPLLEVTRLHDRLALRLRDLRVGEVVRQDVTIEDGRITTFRVRLNVSFRYES